VQLVARKKHTQKPPPLFDGARFLTRAFYINRLSAQAVKRAPSKAHKNHRTSSCTEVESFVHQDARDNMKSRCALNNA